ncbi:hypothetical protein F4782DRAFT_550153 [Xylaria castorea]|nr:hypothetical protein F4782DRAFT_550153 [Xylaria castorea]
MIYAYRGIDLTVTYIYDLKAGTTVSVLDLQYTPERQNILLNFARPKFLVYIQKATNEFVKLSSSGTDFIINNLDLKCVVSALRLSHNGEIDINLSQHPFVRENATEVRRDKDEEQTLVTYFVPETKRFQYLQPHDDGEAIEQETADESMTGILRRFKLLSDDCKKFLAAKVLKYAIPSIFILLA